MWDRLPPLDAPEEDLLLAEEHRGVCLRCHVDVQGQRKLLGDSHGEEAVVPKFSYLNHMDLVFNFPHEELASLFAQATLTESMFLALEHMQVSFVTVQRTRLTKFRKNVISFPQDVASFVERVGLLCRYERGDRVNSTRGPGDDPARYHVHSAGATPEQLKRHAVDENGYLVFRRR